MAADRASLEPTPIVLARDPDQLGLEMKPVLITRLGARLGRDLPMDLAHPEMLDVWVPDQSVSKLHAYIERIGDTYLVRDDDTTNGTFVNEFRVSRFPIKPGDQVRLGGLKFGVHRQEALDDLSTPAKTLSCLFPDQDPARGVEKVRRHVPSCGFGVLRVRGYEARRESLSDLGAPALEKAISTRVVLLMNDRVYAIRRRDGGDLWIDLIVAEGLSVQDYARRLVAELQSLFHKDFGWSELKIEWSVSSLDPSEAERKLLAKIQTPRTTQAALEGRPRRARGVHGQAAEFRWIQVNDLHCGAGAPHWRHNSAQVNASLVRDLKRTPFVADRVFVVGDVANKAKASEYDTAFDYLQPILAAVDCDLSRARIVPGNHDVDRDITSDTMLDALHHYARTKDQGLDRLLSSSRTRDVLLEPLGGFQGFIRRFDGHPTTLDWHELITVGSSHVEVWGLCSVWGSDGNDGKDPKDPTRFCPNLPFATGQYRDRSTTWAPVNLVITHHPIEWMLPSHASWFRSAFASGPTIHLSGHIHQNRATRPGELGRDTQYIPLIADAAHAAEGEKSSHGYSRGRLRLEADGRWRVDGRLGSTTPGSTRSVPIQGCDWTRKDFFGPTSRSRRSTRRRPSRSPGGGERGGCGPRRQRARDRAPIE